MACCCKNVPTIFCTAITSNQTTGITTLTLNAPVPTSGAFNIRFNCCSCTKICCCGTYPVNLEYNGTAYAQVYDRNMNRLLIGQLARQIMCHKCAHFYASETNAGAIISKDCLPSGMRNGPTTNEGNTTVSTVTGAA